MDFAENSQAASRAGEMDFHNAVQMIQQFFTQLFVHTTKKICFGNIVRKRQRLVPLNASGVNVFENLLRITHSNPG